MRKGQSSAVSIMVLLILLALFIVLYVLLLPPAERDALLNLNGTSNTSNGIYTTNSNGQDLLYEMPGTIVPDQQNQIVHNMDPINLFVKSQPTVNTIASSVSVERSDFGGQDQTINFNVDNLDNLNSLYLVFTVTNAKGILNIELNGQNIYSKQAKVGSQEMVTLNKNQIKSVNELKFSVSSPGIAFFFKNSYTIENIVMKQQLELINSKETRIFSVADQEKNNIRDSKLTYSVYCNSLQDAVTSLKVYLNDNLLTSEIISCGGNDQSVDIDPNKLNIGQNNLLFVIDNGDFTLSQVKVTNNLQQNLYTVYEFSIAQSDYQNVLNGNQRVVLRMSFANTTASKSGRILVNNDQIALDTNSDKFVKDISKSVTDGVNKLRIVPVNSLNIDTLRVDLEST